MRKNSNGKIPEEKEKLNPNGLEKHKASGSESEPLLQSCDSDGEWSQSRPSQQFNVVRRVYQQDALNKDADYQAPHKPWKSVCRKVVRSCGFGECLMESLPIVRWLPRYSPKRFLLSDLVAGATTAVMHIPQGMAYALLAEVPAIVGLYMAFFPVLIYVIFGTSPHVSMGTFAVACLMAGKVVTQHATVPDLNITLFEDPERLSAPSLEYTPIEVLSIVTISVGIFQILMWMLRLGAVSTLLSEPLVSGFTTAASFHVIASQLKDLVGIKIPKRSGNYKIIILLRSCEAITILMWMLRLGAVSTLLSEPLVSGFTTAASFHVIASQLKDLVGIKIPKRSGNYKIIKTVIDIFQNISNTNLTALLISFIACLIIALNNELLKPWVSKRSRVPVPIELLAIVCGTLVSKFAGLNALYDISLVGNIPTGLPVPQIPPLELFPKIAVDAFTITMVTYTISMSMALIFAARDKYEINANQELLALGASNVFGSFFICAPLCASLSRSYIQYQAGAKTGVTSIVSALLILSVLLWIGPFFEDLPRCVLASIIVVSLKGMFMQVKDLAKFWKLSKLDAVVWLVTFLVTAFVNIDIGLAAGLVASVGALFCRSQRPYTCLLGRVLNTDLYLDIKRYRAAEELPGIKIFHYCGGLNFATKNLFRETLFRKIGYNRIGETHLETDEDNNLAKSESGEWQPSRNVVRCVIIDATALSYVDGPGIKSLVAVQKELVASHITVLFAGANGPVLEMIDKYNSLESDRLQLDTFPTVHDAVVYYKMLETKRQKKTSITIA